jgi:hypothetical protein
MVGAVLAEDQTKPLANLERPPMDLDLAVEIVKVKGIRFLAVADPLRK